MTSGKATTQSSFYLGSRWLQVLAVSIVSVVFILFVWSDATSAQVRLDNAGHVEARKSTTTTEEISKGKTAGNVNNNKNSKHCLGICNTRQDARKKRFGGNILDRGDVLQMATKEKEALIEKLRVDYGEYFEPIFKDPESSTDEELRFRGYDPITEDGPSLSRLKRKLQIKVLEVQTKIESQDSDVNGCNCNIDSKENTSNQRSLQSSANKTTDDDSELEKRYARYVWATGGHSAAAGHGNLYNESYTAFMERDLKPLFDAIGIEFEGRNYAMGAMSASPEIAMCWNQIFGTDVDIFAWDYGMTDGNEQWKMLLYGYRGGMSPGRPAFLAVSVGGRSWKRREGSVEKLESMGLASFVRHPPVYDEMMKAIPESSGIPEEEIKKLPEYVRNYKCEGKWEAGDPYCAQEKYSKYGCSPRSKQVSWHPGFKNHALIGNALALFLMQAFVDALKELADNGEQDPNLLLRQLSKEEDEVFARFLNESVPTGFKDLDTGILGKEEIETLWTDPSFCRTGLTPSRSRYLGYATNSDKVGEFAVLGQERYDIGLSIDKAKLPDAANGELKLVFDAHEDNRNEPCGDVILKPDYKDFFFAHNNHGLVELTIPNEKERLAYGYDEAKVKGKIIIFFSRFNNRDELRQNEFAEGKFEIFVNDKKVTQLVPLKNGGFVCKGDEGFNWPASSNGDYKIGVEVKQLNKLVRLQSIVLY